MMDDDRRIPTHEAPEQPRILLLEDDRLDAELVKSILRTNGVSDEIHWVTSRDDYLQAVEERDYDVVLSDFSMPGFDGLTALHLLRERDDDSAFIFVSGNIGEERAINALRSGATDYVLKDNLRRLAPSVKRAWEDLAEAREKRRIEHQLVESERRFRCLMASCPSVIYSAKAGDSHTLSFVSPNFEEVCGYPADELVGLSGTWQTRIHGDDVTRVLREFRRQLDTQGHGVLEYRLQRADGSFLWVHDSFRLLTDNTDGDPEVVGSWTDVTEAHALSEELSYQASHDPLTGLLNRREFERTLERLISRAPVEQATHVLCYIDLDQFKVINDTCGHVAGDELLKEVSKRIATHVRRTDICARLGGDEFGLLFQYCSMAAARPIVEAIRNAVDNHRTYWDNKLFRVSASMGLALIDKTTPDTVEALKMADEACYIAKESGRNRISVYDPDDTQLALRRAGMHGVALVNEALAHDGFRLYHQRIAPMGERSARDSFEILLRIESPDGKVILPGAFLPSAERYDLAPKVDRWVLDEVFGWLAEADSPPKFNLVSVNLSGQTVSDRGVLDHILGSIQALDLDPQQLCFEITETAAVSNCEEACHFVSRLRDAGCHVAIDDFGTGMSSFAYLKNLPVDYLKIDGSFVRTIASNELDLAMVTAITEIGHKIGLKVVAEWAQDESILEVLRSIGIDYAQGYAIGEARPLMPR